MNRHVIIADTTLGGPLFSGAQTFLMKLAPGLASFGWRVTVLVETKVQPEYEAALKAGGVNLVSGLWRLPSLMEDIAPRLADWINCQSPDVYIISVSPGSAWVPLPYIDPQIRTASIAHTDSETFYAPIKHYAGFISKAIGVSQEVCRRLVEDCCMPAYRVSYQPYGVVTASSEEIEQLIEYTEDVSPLRLIYVGRLEEPQKRITDLVTIVKRLRGEDLAFVLDVVGDGPEASSIKSQLASEVNKGIVRFYGWISEDDVIARLRKADVFLLFSEKEGLPIALLEAMGNGVAPMITDIPSGNRQLVTNGSDGYLIPVGDVEQFVGTIVSLSKRRNHLRELRRKAWQTARGFSVERMVKSYADMFEETIAMERASEAIRPAPDFPLMASCQSPYPILLRRMKISALRLAQQLQ
jgi:glycosyltransferase involved in cell wall biosynthesis